jgi:Tfp pilus assembly protein PilF
VNEAMRKTIVVIAAGLLSACAATGSIFQSKGEQAFSSGLSQYENGEYAEAQKSFAAALEAGIPLKDQVEARKHLAFVHCVSGRQAQCREEFRRALDLNPQLELTPAEAGHPSWGPAFRAVKAARR